jgi:hypothetical protein
MGSVIRNVLDAYRWANTSSSQAYYGANVVGGWSIDVPFPIEFSKIAFSVITADTNGSDKYDFGIYDLNGNLVANVGAQAFISTGLYDLTVTQGTVALEEGKYIFAATGTAGTLAIAFYDPTDGSADANELSALNVTNSGGGSSTGGALPSLLGVVPSFGTVHDGTTGQSGNGVPTFVLH